MAADRHF